jgi:hypothetical protein
MGCMKGGYFDDRKIGREERKGSMRYAAEVKLRNMSRISFGEYLASLTGNEMLK